MFKRLKFNRCMRAICSNDYKKRIAAIQLLGEMGDKQAFESLTFAITDENWQIKQAAAEALGKLGDKRATEHLIGALKYGEPGVQWKAALALGELGDSRAVEPLAEVLSKGNTVVQPRAAQALAQMGDERGLRWIIEALQDEKRNDRASIIEDFRGLADKLIIEVLIKTLGDKTCSIRKAAVEILTRLGEHKWQKWIKGDDDDFSRLGQSNDPQAVEPLLCTLANKDFKTRSVAAKALGELGDKRAVLPLINILPFPPAAEALGKLGDEKAVEPLIKMLGNTRLSNAEVIALGKLGDKRAIEPLIKILTNKSPSVRKAAAESLSILGQPKWQQYVRGDEEDFRRLGESQEPAIVSLLIDALTSIEMKYRPAIARALGNIGDERAVQSLIGVLLMKISRYSIKQGGIDAPVAAAIALGKIGGQQAVEALMKAIYIEGRGESQVRKAAAKAFVNAAKSCPALVTGKWQKIRGFVKVPHTDSHRDHSPPSDCHGDKHSDSGIGVDFPEKPPIKSLDF